MDKNELKAEWLEALRGDKYQQGTCQLKSYDLGDGSYYCCLGVAGDILVKHGVATWDREFLKVEDDEYPVTYETELGSLGAYFGVTPEIEETLIYMNDTDQEDFDTIANWIEANV